MLFRWTPYRIVSLLWVVTLLLLAGSESRLLADDLTQPTIDDPNIAHERISLNFDNTDLRTVINMISEITGITFAVDESIRGNITLVSPTDILVSDVYRRLETALDLAGFAAIYIHSSHLVKIIPKADAVKYVLPVRYGADPNQIPVNDTLVTQVMPLKYASANEMNTVIRNLLSPDAKVSVDGRTNNLVVTDTSAKIHYVATLIQTLDIQSPSEQSRIFSLDYASAQDLSEHLQEILNKKQDRYRSGRNNNTGSSTVSQQVRIIPNLRTNTIMAIGTQIELDTVAQLIKDLDVPRREGAEEAHVVYLKNGKAKEMSESLTAALSDMHIGNAVDARPAVRVTADEGTNSIIITGPPQEFAIIDQIIEKLDVVRETVLVEMLIVEASQEKLTEIGIDWQTMNHASSGTRGFAGTNLGPRVDYMNGDLEGLALGAYRGAIGNASDIMILLSAMQNESGFNILSTPHITTLNHSKAKIIVGEERAFVTNSRVTEDANPSTPTVIKTYEYKDVGITLDITPHISQGGGVRLEIDSALTKVLPEATLSPDTPTTAKREATTVVSMQSGETVVIGGLIRDDTTKTVKKVPLLGDIPGLGGLFRHKSDTVQKTNLLMFITPHVMDRPEQRVEMTKQKESTMQQYIDMARQRSQGKLPDER